MLRGKSTVQISVPIKLLSDGKKYKTANLKINDSAIIALTDQDDLEITFTVGMKSEGEWKLEDAKVHKAPVMPAWTPGAIECSEPLPPPPELEPLMFAGDDTKVWFAFNWRGKRYELRG